MLCALSFLLLLLIKSYLHPLPLTEKNMIIIPTDKTKSDTNSFRIFALLLPMNKKQQSLFIMPANNEE